MTPQQHQSLTTLLQRQQAALIRLSTGIKQGNRRPASMQEMQARHRSEVVDFVLGVKIN